MRGDDEAERRSTDRRLERIETDVKDMVAAYGEERTMIHEDLARGRAWQQGHEKQCTERWKANDEKWIANAERFNTTDGKLNAIIGTSFLTLLAVCGFFIALWIDRQDEHSARRVDHVTHPTDRE